MLHLIPLRDGHTGTTWFALTPKLVMMRSNGWNQGSQTLKGRNKRQCQGEKGKKWGTTRIVMKIMKKSNKTTCEALFPLLVTFSTKRGGVFRSNDDLATIITIILINTDLLTMKVV